MRASSSSLPLPKRGGSLMATGAPRPGRRGAAAGGARGRAARHPGHPLARGRADHRHPGECAANGPELGPARVPADRLPRRDRQEAGDGGSDRLRALADRQEHDPRPAEHPPRRERGGPRSGHDRLAAAAAGGAAAGRADRPGWRTGRHGRRDRDGDHRRGDRRQGARRLHLPRRLALEPRPDPSGRGPGGVAGPGVRRRARGDRACPRPDRAPPLSCPRGARLHGHRLPARTGGLGPVAGAADDVALRDDRDRLEGRQRDDRPGADACRPGRGGDFTERGPAVQPGGHAGLLQRLEARWAGCLRRIHRHRTHDDSPRAPRQRPAPGARARPDGARPARWGALPRPIRLREHVRPPDAPRGGQTTRYPDDLRPPAPSGHDPAGVWPRVHEPPRRLSGPDQGVRPELRARAPRDGPQPALSSRGAGLAGPGGG